MSSDLERLISRVEQVLERFEATLPPRLPAPDWKKVLAYRWRRRNGTREPSSAGDASAQDPAI